MDYVKTVKVSKQGGLTITLPKVMCEMLKIKAGDELTLIMDTDVELITMTKHKLPTIFKISKPLYGDLNDALIYNEDKSQMFQRPFTEVKSLFKKDELKVYVEGNVDSSGLFHIFNKVAEQDW